MTAYMIFTREKTIDPSELEVYGNEVGGTVAGHPITLLVKYGAFEMLEGDAIEGAVVVQFPTVADAKAYYNSPAYQKAAIHRHAGANYRVFIVEGVN
jgi:uncharacterized protein (DUF1330 family)